MRFHVEPYALTFASTLVRFQKGSSVVMFASVKRLNQRLEYLEDRSLGMEYGTLRWDRVG